jgi:hypothetical protein
MLSAVLGGVKLVKVRYDILEIRLAVLVCGSFLL